MPDPRRPLIAILILCLSLGWLTTIPARSAPPGVPLEPGETQTATVPAASPTEKTPDPSDAPTPQPAVAVTSVEPHRIPGETGGRLSIYGTGFGPGTAVRLVDYGLLDTVVVNTTAL